MTLSAAREKKKSDKKVPPKPRKINVVDLPTLADKKAAVRGKSTKVLLRGPRPPQSDSEEDGGNDSEEEEQGKKLNSAKSSKQSSTPKLISANADAKLKSSSTTKPTLKKTKLRPPTPTSSLSSEAEADDKQKNGATVASSADEDENDHLQGFSTDDDDSSDEDTAPDKGLSPYEVSKLPTVAKDDESVKRKLEKAKRQPTEDRGVIYIGRLPHGFYEDQLRGYFSQFGDITRLRVSRNKKTGKCKHYGFIEFDSSSVAQIVAETMDNYLLTGHILKCKLIPKDEIHPELWVGANRKWRVVPKDRIFRVQHNKPRTEEEQEKAAKRLLKRQNERKRKLEALGIEYDFDAVGYKKAKGDIRA